MPRALASRAGIETHETDGNSTTEQLPNRDNSVIKEEIEDELPIHVYLLGSDLADFYFKEDEEEAGETGQPVVSNPSDNQQVEAEPVDFSAWHKCTICPAMFFRKRMLLKHLRNEHPTSKQFQVMNEKVKREEEQVEDEIMKTHYKYDESVKASTTDLLWICELCRKPFTHQSALKRHLIFKNDAKHRQYYHQRDLPCKCTLCPSQFRIKRDLNRHRRVIHQIVDQDTPETTTASSSSASRKRKRPDSPETTQIVDHSNTVASPQPESMEIKEEIEDEPEPHFDSNFVPVCIKEEEEATVEAVQPPKESTGDGPLTQICIKEDEESVERVLPLTQLILPPRSYICHLCQANYVTLRHLSRHLTYDHIQCVGPEVRSGAGRYPCPLCLKNCKNRCDLSNHLRVHTGGQPFVCPLCPEEETRFRTSQILRNHLKKHHSGEEWTMPRPFLCSLCGEAFLEEHHLEDHLLDHKRDEEESKKQPVEAAQVIKEEVEPISAMSLPQPWICEVCQRQYPRKYDLKQHRHGVHRMIRPLTVGVNWNASFGDFPQPARPSDVLCHLCTALLPNYRALRQHLPSHGGERFWKCEVESCSLVFARKGDLAKHRSKRHQLMSPVTVEVNHRTEAAQSVKPGFKQKGYVPNQTPIISTAQASSMDLDFKSDLEDSSTDAMDS